MIINQPIMSNSIPLDETRIVSGVVQEGVGIL
jgi:hypothetical protein